MTTTLFKFFYTVNLLDEPTKLLQYLTINMQMCILHDLNEAIETDIGPHILE